MTGDAGLRKAALDLIKTSEWREDGVWIVTNREITALEREMRALTIRPRRGDPGVASQWWQADEPATGDTPEAGSHPDDEFVAMAQRYRREHEATHDEAVLRAAVAGDASEAHPVGQTLLRMGNRIADLVKERDALLAQVAALTGDTPEADRIGQDKE